MTSSLQAFPPILPSSPHTLILGSMPGGKSLELNQYYAHPQNQFWRFMGDLYGAGPDLPYDDRLNILKHQGIAVWDVVHSCDREGSMDSAIKNPRVNDFETLFKEYPSIQKVVFDSLTAENFYIRMVLPKLAHSLSYHRVPSPSPAHARLDYASKLIIWKEVLIDNSHKKTAGS